MNIYVCSPYGGIENNHRKALEYCRRVAAEGHTPFASHVMLHGVLDEPAGRKAGLQAGLDMLALCSEVWLFGDCITEGMAGEIAKACELGIPVAKVSATGVWVYMNVDSAPARFTAPEEDIPLLEKLMGDTFSKLWDAFDQDTAHDLSAALIGEAHERATKVGLPVHRAYEVLADAVLGMAAKRICARYIASNLGQIEIPAGTP